MPSSNKQATNDDDLMVNGGKKKLQAVILADSFDSKGFKPLSLETPQVLLGLNNVPLLEYVLDFLTGNHVEEVFVVCTSEDLEQYLTSQKTKNNNRTLQVHCIKDTSLTNAGDALRELYKRNVVQSDPFLLMFGNVVANLDLAQAMQAHQERHAKDSAAIMTCILHPVGSTQQARIRPATSDLVVGLDPSQDNRILLYHDNDTNCQVPLPCSFFQAHSQIQVRTDLVDTGIWICSPDVLGRFEDEFDYLHIAQDFVHNSVAEEEEGLQVRIHAHLVSPGEYAAHMVDWATYHAVSQDLLRRWCYPMVADNLHSSPEHYKVHSNYLYRETMKPAKVARSSTLVGPGMLGSRCTIEDDANIQSTVIGHDVQIGRKVEIVQSHLWNNVRVEEGAKISYAVIADNVVIHKNAVVTRGCVIGKGCIIGEGVVLPEFTRITLQQKEEDPFGDNDDDGFDDDFETAGNPKASHDNDNQDDDVNDGAGEDDVAIVGKDGKGHVWVPIDDDDDSEDDDASDDNSHQGTMSIPTLQLQSMGYDTTEHYQQRTQRQLQAHEKITEDDWSGEGAVDALEAERMAEAFSAYTDDTFTFEDTAAPSMVSPTSTEPMIFGRQKGVDVVKELQEICLEFEESSPMENLAIELNSYKFSQNASYADCTMAATLAIVDKLNITPDLSDGKLVAALQQRLVFWAPLLRKLSMGQEEEKAIIQGLERAATANKNAVAEKLSSGNSLRFILQTMHDKDILSEEAILSWAADRKQEDASSPLGCLFALPSIQEFLEWLEEESDDDSDEDDDDSE